MYNKYKQEPNFNNEDIYVSITHLENGTFIAKVIDFNKGNSSVFNGGNSYDGQGALIYVCAVLVIYGFSIFLMIGSLIKKSMSDHGVSVYMKNMDTLRRVERRQAKFKTRMAISNKHAKNNKRFDRAIFGGSGKSESYTELDLPQLCILAEGSNEKVNDTVDMLDETTNRESISSISLPVQIDLSHRDKVNTHTILCEVNDDAHFDNEFEETNINHSALPPRDLPEVVVDFTDETDENQIGDNFDCSVVSAFILPTLPAKVEIHSSVIEGFGRRMSSSSILQLKPLFETDEESILV